MVPDDDRFTVASPTVLIYHTHTQEAYSQVSDDLYVEVSQWRTADRAHSVVRVGEELARLLTERGFVVTHDATDHEPPKLSTAYARSLKTIQSYPQHFDLYIDLHRDAYVEGGGPVPLQRVEAVGAVVPVLSLGGSNGRVVVDDAHQDRDLAGRGVRVRAHQEQAAGL